LIFKSRVSGLGGQVQTVPLVVKAEGAFVYLSGGPEPVVVTVLDYNPEAKTVTYFFSNESYSFKSGMSTISESLFSSTYPGAVEAFKLWKAKYFSKAEPVRVISSSNVVNQANTGTQIPNVVTAKDVGTSLPLLLGAAYLLLS
jgi:hypothetical protein